MVLDEWIRRKKKFQSPGGDSDKGVSSKPPDGLSIPVNYTSVVTALPMFRRNLVLVLSEKKLPYAVPCYLQGNTRPGIAN